MTTMKKKLVLSAETVRILGTKDLRNIVGGEADRQKPTFAGKTCPPLC
jgi:hypothetical protein